MCSVLVIMLLLLLQCVLLVKMTPSLLICVVLCCKMNYFPCKMAMSLKNSLSVCCQDNNKKIFDFNHFSMVKMTGLDSCADHLIRLFDL